MFKKADIILASIIIITAFIMMLVVYLLPFEGEPVVSVYINGDKIDTFTFDEEYTEIPITTFYGYNLLIISDNMAFIEESDCHTKSCVSNRVISRPGDTIVCAPHHLVIKIETIDEVN